MKGDFCQSLVILVKLKLGTAANPHVTPLFMKDALT